MTDPTSVAARVSELIHAGQAPTAHGVDTVLADAAVLLGDQGLAAARQELSAHVLGAGPLQPWLDNPEITDILVNGTNGVWIDDPHGLRRIDCDLGDTHDVRRLAVRLAGQAGRRLDDTSPYVDGCLPGGIRLHAVLPPLVDGAAHLSLRIPRRTAPTLDDLTAWGSIPPHWRPTLHALVEHRLSYVITGGTGTGKTTLLAALLHHVPHQERIVVVEDVRELAVPHPHTVRLEGRAPNVEGRGGIDLVTLVRQSLRMRPDRLILGEVRGAEVRELLTALNTGHEGGAGTIHANHIHDVIPRFEALGALAGMTPAAVRSQMSSALDVVLHLRRSSHGRELAAIGILTGRDDHLAVLTALHVDDPTPGPGWPLLAQRLHLPLDHPCQ
ncbi:putative conjugal transfer protein [Austwickia sp. TVS 96-490-7B]|uniref:TadA family conjugal transfer-associated ATPase n=1 Tax=Austwickia sp. TVS 96-490-7B TaxID=2830843 RepID=UPI001C58C905|nr:TadA family conjugal transfer-associated ATPase [Austwickia sp. TVS 96-490-7B]MBW3084899.1 putative conjugal transfer protein [Austwickia sp. TVS 96-490-7B]